MVNRLYRTRNHPKLPDTFERLQAQAQARAQAQVGEPKTSSAVHIWLDQVAPPPSERSIDPSPTSPILSPASYPTRHPRSTILPLQPAHGNQLSPTRFNLKRKMPDSSDTNTRQSARIKIATRSTPADDRPRVEDNEGVATGVSRKHRKATSKTKEEDRFDDAPGDTVQKKEVPSLGHFGSGMKSSQRMLLGEGAAKFPSDSSTRTTPSKASSSRCRKSGSPSKALIPVDKRERMEFMVPGITFRTLEDTNENGDLEGMLQKLWHHINCDGRKIIPSTFKASNLFMRTSAFALLTVLGDRRKLKRMLTLPIRQGRQYRILALAPLRPSTQWTTMLL